MRWQQWVFGLVAMAVFLLPRLAWAISPGQTADFQDGTIQNWLNGGSRGPLPANIENGGPLGGSDHYLQVSSGVVEEQGFPPRLITFNQTAFAGNYLAAGISAISMDLKNFSPADVNTGIVPSLPMRIALEGGFSGQPPAYVSNAIVIASDGAWHHVVFNLSAADMNSYFTDESLSDLLAGVTEMRIMAAANLGLNGDNGSYRVGIDNIHGVVQRGDWNLDGTFNTADVQAMLDGLADLPAYQTAKNVNAATLLAIGDFNSDGAITNGDIQPLLDAVAIGSGSISAVPEPATWMMVASAAAVLGCMVCRRNRGGRPVGGDRRS